jgi:hypothetical protein
MKIAVDRKLVPGECASGYKDSFDGVAGFSETWSVAHGCVERVEAAFFADLGAP